MRDDLWRDHPQIHIVDFDFFSIQVFNQCENSRDIMMTIDNWKNVHPLLKTVPVDWSYTIPFGLLHAPRPSATGPAVSGRGAERSGSRTLIGCPLVDTRRYHTA